MTASTHTCRRGVHPRIRGRPDLVCTPEAPISPAGQHQHTAERADSPLTPAEWIRVAKVLLLAPRELELVRCLCQNKDDPAIAQALGVTPRRVHTYLHRLYRKLGVHSRAATVLRVFAEYINLPENRLTRLAESGSSRPDQPA
jgi:DNA-binding CsgD family transcriptional regulator